MAAIAKTGAFAALLRVFVSTLPTLRDDWQPIVWVIAVLSLVLGAFVAIVQRDVKRMLAYSSINHAGFILLGLQVATTRGIAASLYYIFTYALIVMGSFAVVALVGKRGDDSHSIDDFRGLARRQPVLATTFAVLLLAQAGSPFTTGFIAKLYVIEAAVAAHSYALAVIAMVSAAAAAFFYLRIVFAMFGSPAGATDTALEVLTVAVPQAASPASLFADVATLGGGGVAVIASTETLVAVGGDARGTDDLGPTPLARLGVSPWVATALLCTAGATVLFGVWPQQLTDFAHQATLLF
jgi:NADH-quinone oxidoreductase subunit N